MITCSSKACSKSPDRSYPVVPSWISSMAVTSPWFPNQARSLTPPPIRRLLTRGDALKALSTPSTLLPRVARMYIAQPKVLIRPPPPPRPLLPKVATQQITVAPPMKLQLVRLLMLIQPLTHVLLMGPMESAHPLMPLPHPDLLLPIVISLSKPCLNRSSPWTQIKDSCLSGGRSFGRSFSPRLVESQLNLNQLNSMPKLLLLLLLVYLPSPVG